MDERISKLTAEETSAILDHMCHGHGLDAALARGGEEAAAIMEWWAERGREVDAELWDRVRQMIANPQPMSPPTLTRGEIAAAVYAQITALKTHTPSDIISLLMAHYDWREAHRVAADLIEEWSAAGKLIIRDPDVIARVLREVADGERVMWSTDEYRLAYTSRARTSAAAIARHSKPSTR